MIAWRGTALILEKSHLSARGRVLRHPLTRAIVATPPTQKLAVKYCAQNGYTWMLPVANVDMAAREQRI